MNIEQKLTSSSLDRLIKSINQYVNILIFVISENEEKPGLHLKIDIETNDFSISAGPYFIDEDKFIRNSLTYEPITNGTRLLNYDDILTYICDNLEISDEAREAYEDYKKYLEGYLTLVDERKIAEFPKTRTILNTHITSTIMKDEPITIKQNENGQYAMVFKSSYSGSEISFMIDSKKDRIGRYMLDTNIARKYAITPEELPYLNAIFSLGYTSWKSSGVAYMTPQDIYNLTNGRHEGDQVQPQQLAMVDDIVINGFKERSISLDYSKEFEGKNIKNPFTNEIIKGLVVKDTILQVKEVFIKSANNKLTKLYRITTPDLYVYAEIKAAQKGQATNLLKIDQRLYEDELVKLPGEKVGKKLTASTDKNFICEYLLSNIQQMISGLRDSHLITLKNMYGMLGTPKERALQRVLPREIVENMKMNKAQNNNNEKELTEKEKEAKEKKEKEAAEKALAKRIEKIGRRDRDIIERKLTDLIQKGYIKGYTIKGSRPIIGYNIILNQNMSK